MRQISVASRPFPVNGAERRIIHLSASTLSVRLNTRIPRRQSAELTLRECVPSHDNPTFTPILNSG
ncbi:hypothetical protein [Citrobacter amalonaticus]|uniref:hypothetical protein n=1 Tax=Citrobacter amalonaticus TaxID=35703 RepID=UPI0011AEE646|nr:hypothetical protein [Citrobacter amalonaticus]